MESVYSVSAAEESPFKPYGIMETIRDCLSGYPEYENPRVDGHVVHFDSHGISVTLTADEANASLQYFCDIGEPDPYNTERFLRRMLEANLFLLPRGLRALAFNGESGRVLVVGTVIMTFDPFDGENFALRVACCVVDALGIRELLDGDQDPVDLFLGKIAEETLAA